MHLCRKFILLISIIFSVIFFLLAIFHSFTFVIEGTLSTTYRVTILDGVNPNSAAQVVAILYIILFLEYISRKDVTCIFLLCLDIVTLLILGSRTSLISTLIISLVIVLGDRSLKNKGIVILAMASLLFVIIFLSRGELVNQLDRFSVDTVLDDSASGRFISWPMYFNNIVPYYWQHGIGVGKESFGALGYSFDSDNLYMDLLCETGVPGILLFIAILILFFHHTRHNKHYLPVYLIRAILLSFLVLGLGETIFDAPLVWFIMMYGILSANELNYRVKFSVK